MTKITVDLRLLTATGTERQLYHHHSFFTASS